MDDRRSEPETPPEERELLIQIGRLVLTWNDLDALVHRFIFLVTMDGGSLAVWILTADMNTSAALNALRTLAVEHDASNLKSYRRMAASPGMLPAGTKEPQPFAPHILHFIEYVDRLREYRNFYVHGIRSPQPNGGLEARSHTARGRLLTFLKPITLGDLSTLTTEIKKCVEYGRAVYRAIDQSDHWARYASLPGEHFALPTWPETPPLPDKLVKPRLVLPDE